MKDKVIDDRQGRLENNRKVVDKRRIVSFWTKRDW